MIPSVQYKSCYNCDKNNNGCTNLLLHPLLVLHYLHLLLVFVLSVPLSSILLTSMQITVNYPIQPLDPGHVTLLIKIHEELHMDTIHSITIQYNSTVQYSTVQCSAVQYSAVQYSAVQYSAVQYSAVQYSTVQYSTVQYSTVQYSIG